MCIYREILEGSSSLSLKCIKTQPFPKQGNFEGPLADLSFLRWYANLSYGLGHLLLVRSFCTLVVSLGGALHGPKRSPSHLLLSRDFHPQFWSNSFATSHDRFSTPKGSKLEGKSPQFRKMKVGEILFHLARWMYKSHLFPGNWPFFSPLEEMALIPKGWQNMATLHRATPVIPPHPVEHPKPILT